MADIFVSYATGNRRKISVLTGLFESLGWQVWWDQELRAGAEWSEEIQREVEDAKCVVVAWSRTAVVSEWVNREATIGLENNKLVPILLEPVSPPAEFAHIHAARLTAWAGGAEAPELGRLLHQVAEKLGSDIGNFDPGVIEHARREFSRVDVAEAVFDYCSASFDFREQRDESSAAELGPAYERLRESLSPISDSDLHELVERYLGRFAP